jgi:phosphate uptake regulator
MIRMQSIFREDSEMNLSLALHSFLLSRYIERIGDHGVRLAKSVKVLLQREYRDDKVMGYVEKAQKYALSIFENAMKSFFSNDLVVANQTIDMVEKLIPLCKGILSFANKSRGPVAISLAYISESIRRVGEYAGDIAEDTINYIMENKKEVKI